MPCAPSMISPGAEAATAAEIVDLHPPVPLGLTQKVAAEAKLEAPAASAASPTVKREMRLKWREDRMLLRLIRMMRLLERDVVIGAREERIVRGELLEARLRRIQTGGNCSAERPGWQRKFRSAFWHGTVKATKPPGPP